MAAIRATGKPRPGFCRKHVVILVDSPVCLAWMLLIHQTYRHDRLSIANRQQYLRPDFIQPHIQQSKRTFPAIAFWLSSGPRFLNNRDCLPATHDVRSAEQQRRGTNGLH